MRLVSILMPVYNCELYIEEAIQSILFQTFSDFELIIIDDCSEDQTGKIIKSFKDDRIRHFRNKSNKGIIKTLNDSIKHCNGIYIARMDGDDIAQFTRIEKQFHFLRQNPEYGLVGCWYIIRNNFNSRNLVVKRQILDEKIKFHIFFRNQFLHPGIMIRKNLLKKFKYHDVSTCEDYDLWVRLIKHCKVANLPEVLMVYRWHGENISIKNQQSLRRSMIDIISRLLNEYGIEHTHEELLLQVMVALALPREHFIKSGKITQLAAWFQKICDSESLKLRFGEQQVLNGMIEYKQLYQLR